MGGRCAVSAAVAAWLGLHAGRGLAPHAVLGVLAIALGLLGLARRAPPRVAMVSLLAALALAAAARGAGHRLALANERAAMPGRTDLYRLVADVVEPPRDEAGEPVVVARVRRSDPPLLAGTRVRLRLPSGVDVVWGDRLEALARLEAPLDRRNPGGFDARSAADASAIAAGGRAFTARVRGGGWTEGWRRSTTERWRRALLRPVATRLAPATQELVVPLLLGDRSALTPALDARLRAAGLVHLLALSGLHVTWLAAVARGLAAALGAGVRMRAAVGAACALLYVALAGPLASLARAAAAELLVAAARLAERALDPVQALAVGVLALLAVAPGWEDDLGFQLSCAATLGLVAIGPALQARGRWRPLAAAVAPTIAAQVVALPLLVGRLHALSWTSPLTNVAAVPVSGLLLAAAWSAALVEALVPGAGAAWLGACDALAALLRAIAEWGASAPSALLGAGCERGVAGLAAAGAILLVVAATPERTLAGARQAMPAWRVAALGAGSLASALSVLLIATAPALRPPPGTAWVVALDVGQGDALALACDDGWWLVDAGPRSVHWDAGVGVVLPFFRWAGVRRLGAVVVTHDDGDHAGGAPEVVRALRPARVWTPPPLPGVPGPGPKLGGRPVARGDTLHRAPLVHALWPARLGDRAAGEPAPHSDNTAALVLEVGAGRGRALLLADVDTTVERALAVAPGVALLKVGHHGSRTSTSAALLDAARPRIAIVSCGRRNPFGHPAAEVIARLAANGVEIRRTDASGALWFELGDDGARLVEWRNGPPRRELSAGVARSMCAALAAREP